MPLPRAWNSSGASRKGLEDMDSGNDPRPGEGPLGSWLQERRPAVPAPFLEILLVPGREASATPEGLVSLAVEALQSALARPGRVRESAFHLLAGDAFLTYACEALARSPRPGEELGTLLEQMGVRLR